MGHGEGVEIQEELEIHHEDQEVAKVGMLGEVRGKLRFLSWKRYSAASNKIGKSN
jgi:hypothetical protein